MANTETIRCAHCGANNRVSIEQIERGLIPVCGKCKTPLSAGNAPIAITDATFSDQVEKSTLPILVDFWAPWCGPCRLIAPALDELASEMSGRIRFAKLNIDENPRTAARFKVESIPLLIIFKSGREIDRMVGAHPKASIAQHLQQFLK